MSALEDAIAAAQRVAGSYAQGGTEGLVDALKSEALAQLNTLYTHATVTTQYSPPLDVNLTPRTEDAGTPQGHLLLRMLRPTVTLEGPAGVRVIAPYGQATPGAGARNLALGTAAALGTVALLGFALGRASKPSSPTKDSKP